MTQSAIFDIQTELAKLIERGKAHGLPARQLEISTLEAVMNRIRVEFPVDEAESAF